MKEQTLQRILEEIIDEVSENICDNFCKYRDTCDEDALCDYIRDGKSCPLDKLH